MTMKESGDTLPVTGKDNGTEDTATSCPPGIVVHHLENAQSQRILWLLEELDIPYDIKHYGRSPQRIPPRDLFEIHPLGSSPLITDGSSVTLAQSGAIIEYLSNKYGNDKVQLTEEQWADNIFYSRYAEATLQEHLYRRLLFQTLPDNSSFLLRPFVRRIFSQYDKLVLAPEIAKHGKFVEEHLKKTNGWFLGTEAPTTADYMMSLSLEIFINTSPENVGPKTKAYIDRVQRRPAYKRALEKGGENAYLLPQFPMLFSTFRTRS